MGGLALMGIILFVVIIGVLGIIAFVVVAGGKDKNNGKDETMVKPRYREKK